MRVTTDLLIVVGSAVLSVPCLFVAAWVISRIGVFVPAISAIWSGWLILRELDRKHAKRQAERERQFLAVQKMLLSASRRN